jgi:hypothetical protein
MCLQISLLRLFPGEKIICRYLKVVIKVGKQMIDRHIIDTLALPGMKGSEDA